MPIPNPTPPAAPPTSTSPATANSSAQTPTLPPTIITPPTTVLTFHHSYFFIFTLHLPPLPLQLPPKLIYSNPRKFVLKSQEPKLFTRRLNKIQNLIPPPFKNIPYIVVTVTSTVVPIKSNLHSQNSFFSVKYFNISFVLMICCNQQPLTCLITCVSNLILPKSTTFFFA